MREAGGDHSTDFWYSTNVVSNKLHTCFSISAIVVVLFFCIRILFGTGVAAVIIHQCDEHKQNPYVPYEGFAQETDQDDVDAMPDGQAAHANIRRLTDGDAHEHEVHDREPETRDGHHRCNNTTALPKLRLAQRMRSMFCTNF